MTIKTTLTLAVAALALTTFSSAAFAANNAEGINSYGMNKGHKQCCPMSAKDDKGYKKSHKHDMKHKADMKNGKKPCKKHGKGMSDSHEKNRRYNM